jgi:PEGA domain
MSRAPWGVPFVISLLLGGAAGAADSAVVAVGKCDESAGIAARSFRTALSQKPGVSVQTEAETAQPFGGITDRTLASVNTAIGNARSDFYSDRPAEAKKELQGALDDVARVAPSEARWSSERDALTLMAQVQQKTDKVAAEAAINRILRVQPDYKPDTGLYPPSFQKWFAGVKKTAKKKATVRFEVTTAPAGKTVYVGGRPVGKGPVVLRVPAGDFRVEADWGHRGVVRNVTVPSPPIELSTAVDGAVNPEGGPCVEATDPVPALARVAKATGVGRVYGVHPEGSDPEAYMVVTSVDPAASDVREARVKVAPGAPSTEALAALADTASGGTVASSVEITRGPGAAPAAAMGAGVAAGVAAGAAAGGAATATPAPAAAAPPAPSPVHFEASLRVGFGLPLGSVSENLGSVSNYSSFTIPVQLDLGIRISGVIFLGAYFSYGFAGSTDAATCGSGFNCSPSTLRFGGEIHWHPLGNAPVDPWIGLGSGYEKMSISVSGDTTGTFDVSGWEFGNLQLGLDFAIGSVVKIGPWVSFSIGQYSSGSISGGGNFTGADIQNKTIHEWLMGGVRLVIIP